MRRIFAVMRKGNEKITAECYEIRLLDQWIRDNEKLGFTLISIGYI